MPIPHATTVGRVDPKKACLEGKRGKGRDAPLGTPLSSDIGPFQDARLAAVHHESVRQPCIAATTLKQLPYMASTGDQRDNIKTQIPKSKIRSLKCVDYSMSYVRFIICLGAPARKAGGGKGGSLEKTLIKKGKLPRSSNEGQYEENDSK